MKTIGERMLSVIQGKLRATFTDHKTNEVAEDLAQRIFAEFDLSKEDQNYEGHLIYFRLKK